MANYISKHTGKQIDAAVDAFLAGGGTGSVEVDATLTQAGKAADAKATGDRITALSKEIEALKGEDTPSEMTYNPDILGFWNISKGQIETMTSTAHTDYLSLEDVISIKASHRLSANGYALAFFDANKNIMPDISVVGVNPDKDTVTVMDVPGGAAYVMLSDYRQKESSGIGYITLYYSASGVNENPLHGKKINVLGNSITSTNYTRPTWWEIIAGKTGAEFNNHGVSGTTIVVRSERSDSFVERAANLEADADAVIVMGGTNDNNIPRGAWDSEDTTTFFGALNNLLLKLCENFAGKPIIFCTPIQTAGGYTSNAANPGTALMGKTDSDALSMQLRAEAIKQKCAQYGVHCLDLYNGSGINGVDADRVYFRTDDTLHPSEIGQKRLANLIYKELLTFFEIN